MSHPKVTTYSRTRHLQHMNKIILIILFLTLILPACGQKTNNQGSSDNGQIQIIWTNKISDDFSFTDKWSYPEGIYKNQFDQLCCDGFCPQRTYSMRDSSGRIFPDSLIAYYQLIDTTHLFHSIKCEAWCYEWAGTDFLKAQFLNRDSIKCYTLTNIATHCSLHLLISNNNCTPTIELNSISKSEKIIYTCSDGYIKIDKGSFENGILKTQFNFNFYHPENPKIKIFWRGIALTIIEKK
jgi:hypothetical protein